MAAIGWNPQQIAKWFQIPLREPVVQKRLLSFCDVIGGHEAAGYSPLLQVYGENAELVVAATWLDWRGLHLWQFARRRSLLEPRGPVKLLEGD